MPETPTRRLFLALWPDAATRRAVVRGTRAAVRKAGGRPVVAQNYHITLAFLGAVPAEACAALCAAVREIDCPSFTLTLDRYGYWPRPRLLWLGASETPAPLVRLVDALWTSLTAQGFSREERMFKPHVSLCRKLHKQPELDAPAPLNWPVHDFVLCESHTEPAGARYTVIERFGRAHSVTQ